jgi:hypothetical protein
LYSFPKSLFYSLFLLASFGSFAQHRSHFSVEADMKRNVLNVIQDLTFYNESKDSIGIIVLNDWNHAYSDKNSWLGKRFSDEFVRTFHLAKESERGSTDNLTVIDAQNSFLTWLRPKTNIDLIEVSLREKVPPGEKIQLHLTYSVRIPDDRFTKYGHDNKGNLTLKNWFLTPARYEDHKFVRYSNVNLDDIANGISDYDLDIRIPTGFDLDTDLDELGKTKSPAFTAYQLSGLRRNDFTLFITPKSKFSIYKNDLVEVGTDLKENKLSDIQKAVVVDRIVHFVNDNIGQYPYQKITVSQVDYERNPFYGLNQLPSFISPFSDEFIFELKFLKTYLNNYLHNSMHLDPRKDNWVYDGIQVYTMMKYIDEHHPNAKMMGSLAKLKLLKSFNVINLDFNEQYSYYYMLMARKNLDQPLGDSKETLIRFNEKIASKYRAGLSLKYLDNYLQDSIVPTGIRSFYAENKVKQATRYDFEKLLVQRSDKKIDWFFNTIIDSREIIDYKFTDVSKTKDSVTFTIRNKTGTTVPIPVYGIKDKQIVFKKWFENVSAESTFTTERNAADKIVLNYLNEVPEYNLRNNWKSLKGFFFNNRPFKFVFMKDLEDPYYNQILYVPTLTYNLYDGLSPGIRLHNKTILDKPFTFDINPIYSPNTQQLTGSFGLGINHYNRDSRFYNIRYGVGGSYSHYAPDAAYLKINPSVNFNIRNNDFRDNRKQGFSVRYNIVHKEISKIVKDNSEGDYSIFGLRYYNAKSEITNLVTYSSDLQLSGNFGKVSGELQYRKLFDNNRQINVRLFAGTFLYHANLGSTTYNFGISKPNDYLFEYNFFGRSETSGLFSQQYFLSEGGFKSFLSPTSANQWLVSTNASFNVWNWIELYGDAGFAKNSGHAEDFLYDSGVRLNLVPDYFELYFPVYSNNGWEITQYHYKEKIRFVVTLSPKTLLNLFTRKWF